jgi:hypothetical protein
LRDELNLRNNPLSKQSTLKQEVLREIATLALDEISRGNTTSLSLREKYKKCDILTLTG